MCTLDAVEMVIIRTVHCRIRDVVLLAGLANLQQEISMHTGERTH